MLESFCFGWVTYDILALLSIYIISSAKTVKANQKVYFFCLACISYIILGVLGNAITPDFPSYDEAIKTIHSTTDPRIHFETFWIYFIKIFGKTYLEYRIALFIISFTLFFIILNKLRGTNKVLFVSFFTVISLYDQIGLRSILFLMTYSISFIFLSEKRYSESIVFLVMSFFLHKVGQFAVVIFLLCLLKIYSKYTILLILTSLCAIAMLINTLIHSELGVIINLMQDQQISGSAYLNHEDSVSEHGNIIWKILEIFTQGVKYILSVVVLLGLWKNRFSFNRLQKYMYNLLFWSTAVSIAILLTGIPDRAIAYRCASVGQIALCYCWSSYSLIDFDNYKKRRPVLILLLLIFLLTQNIFIRGLLNRV